MEFFRISEDIPFMRHALVFNVISLFTFLLAVFFLFSRGLTSRSSITGGTLIELHYAQAANLEKVREGLGKAGYTDLSVQNLGSSKVKDIRDLRKAEATLTSDDFEVRLLALKDELVALKEAKSSAIDALMDEISRKVLKPSFKIDLSQKTGPKEKPVFCIDAKPETFFVIKQLQRNIHGIYGVKQANRHDLVCQVRDTLSSKFPFELVRTDISSFYESINRKRLVEKVDRDQLLSPSSKKYIKQVLESYGKISGAMAGGPRGVGISAYLAELYLRPVDKAIRAIPGLVLYCRFVDDIVAVFARPPTGKNLGSFKDRIITIFGDNELSHNEIKTLGIQAGRPRTEKVRVSGLSLPPQSGEA